MRKLVIFFYIVLACFWIPVGHAQGNKELPYNVLLLTPDQMGADYLHLYGYPLPDTPNLEKLAAEGTPFPYSLRRPAVQEAAFTK